jgi:hypothetical protein
VVSAPRSTNAVLIVPVSVTESIHFNAKNCMVQSSCHAVFHDPVLFRALAA